MELMMESPFARFVIAALDVLSTLFVVALGLVFLIIVVLFFIDITQSADAVRRNYPVLGRFRSLFSELGEFFRQYFFAMDREEMPFNRAERDWVGRASKNKNNTIAFGSTKNLSPAGTSIFVNSPFPALDEEADMVQSLLIGPYAKEPYDAPSFFNISGMSYGALSRPAVRALSRGAKMANCWMNTGEGGVSPYHLESGADIVFQIGTAKYGVRNKEGGLSDEKLREVAAKPQIKMFELKMSQGAKPGKGGILPAIKVNREISEIRGIEEGTASISPNRHPEITSSKDMLDMINHIQKVTGKPVGFKAVIGEFSWIEDMCREIHARGIEHAPDFFTIDSGDGGTGAAPMALMDNVGLTVREALPQTADILHKYGLRDRIRIVVSGKLITPSEVAWALATGADFVTSARGFMFSLGCIQALKCNKNTCPTGITTHNKRLQHGLDPTDKAAKVANYHKNMVHEVEVISHSCGVARPRLMQRSHVRIVQTTGRSITMDELYPTPHPLAEYEAK
ncbi:FMN-binding glutamate synthase family protein [Lentilitoribacter sp. Alg239-R112]|uniref:FMN-binding glutamate synthase family protein n=1 Tax=Lentilitoribacter sp. Alg239-R112 TaxID=2305987 RepID=UPI0013A6C23B|nr:FMN-binding glutamate synthase family protein [Lentilitoribacter sp. Alg239-R112]